MGPRPYPGPPARLRGDFDHLAADPTSGLVFGLLYALKPLADSLGLTAALGKSRLAKLALFLVLACVAHRGSRLSAVRWAANHAVAEVLGLESFDEDDLYAALDDLCARQEAIEKALYRRYLERRAIVLERKQAAIDHALELAGCYVVVTDVPKQQMDERAVHDSYVSLQKVERDFRQMKTGLLEVRPVFVRKESRTQGHVFCCLLALKLSREMERRLQAAYGTTGTDPHAVTVNDAMAALRRLCLLEYQIEENTTLTRLPRPDARQEEILAALGVSLPKK